MYSPTLTTRVLRPLIPALHLPFGMPKIDGFLLRFIVWATIIDVILVSGLFIKLFVIERATPIVYSAGTSVVKSKPIMGSATESFLHELKNNGFDAIAIKNTSRKHFSVGGTIISVNRNSLQTFEYPDHNTALTESTILSKKYASSSLMWKNDIHLYVDGTLVIFYLGNQDDLVKSLESNSELSLK